MARRSFAFPAVRPTFASKTRAMFEEFQHRVGDFLADQTRDLLHKQLSISKAVYTERTGRLNQYLSGGYVRTDRARMEVVIPYPVYIRFLDMRRASVRTRVVDRTVIRNHKKVVVKQSVGRKKRVYAPIYNKYVYGYLKNATYRRLRSVIPSFMIKEFSGKQQ